MAVFTAPEVPFPRVIWVKDAEKGGATQQPLALTFGGNRAFVPLQVAPGIMLYHTELQESDRMAGTYPA